MSKRHSDQTIEKIVNGIRDGFWDAQIARDANVSVSTVLRVRRHIEKTGHYRQFQIKPDELLKQKTAPREKIKRQGAAYAQPGLISSAIRDEIRKAGAHGLTTAEATANIAVYLEGVHRKTVDTLLARFAGQGLIRKQKKEGRATRGYPITRYFPLTSPNGLDK